MARSIRRKPLLSGFRGFRRFRGYLPYRGKSHESKKILGLYSHSQLPCPNPLHTIPVLYSSYPRDMFFLFTLLWGKFLRPFRLRSEIGANRRVGTPIRFDGGMRPNILTQTHLYCRVFAKGSKAQILKNSDFLSTS